VVRLEKKWLTPQVVREVADSVIRRIGFLFEGIPARSEVTARKTDRLMDNSKITRPLLVKNRSYSLVGSIYPQHPVSRL